jgi:hypothetical protein
MTTHDHERRTEYTMDVYWNDALDERQRAMGRAGQIRAELDEPYLGDAQQVAKGSAAQHLVVRASRAPGSYVSGVAPSGAPGSYFSGIEPSGSAGTYVSGVAPNNEPGSYVSPSTTPAESGTHIEAARRR